MGYHIVLENGVGGELDGRFAANEDEISGAVVALARDCVLAAGDVIRIVEEKATATVVLQRRFGDGTVGKLGVAVQYSDGWRFISNVSSHRSSRKFHLTFEKCIPRWTGYPDHCESVEG